MDVRVQDGALMRAALDDVLSAQGLAPCTALVDKAVQLYDSLRMRLGVMLIGPAGKSACSDLPSALFLLKSRSFSGTSFGFARLSNLLTRLTYCRVWKIHLLQDLAGADGLLEEAIMSSRAIMFMATVGNLACLRRCNVC